MGVILLKRKMTMGGGDDDGGADHGAGGGGDGCKGASFGGRGGSRYATPLRSAQRALQVSKRELFSRGFSLVPLGQPHALIN